MSVALANTGAMKLCCVHKSNSSVALTDVISDETRRRAKEAFLANRRFEGCVACWDAEQAGHSSIRHQLNEVARTIRPDFLRSPTDEIAYFDLALGNTCNQKCRMCGPWDSSAWVAELKTLGEVHHNTSRVADIPSIIDAMKHTSGPLWIEVKGGEPFVMPEVTLLFDLLERERLAERVVKMRFMTNGSLYPKHLLPALKRFQSVSIRLSIDAVGDLYRYVRGSKLSFVEVAENIARLRAELPNAYFSIANTVTIQNVFGQADLARWARATDMSLSAKMLYRPSWLDLRYLPADVASTAVTALESYDGPNRAGLLARLGACSEAGRIESEMRQFVENTRRIDRSRGESCLDFIPQLKAVFDRYG